MPVTKYPGPTYSLTDRNGRYYVQWWQEGRPHRVSCRTADKSLALRFLAEFKAGIDAEPIPETPTIGAILDGYFAQRSKQPHSPTLKFSCQTLKRHLADLPANLLGREQVERYTTDRRAEGARGAAAKYRKEPRQLSNGTIIRELGILRRALGWAVNEKWLASAPHVERPPAPPARERWLTEAEAGRLLESSPSPHIRLFIAMALWTGARTGAILELTWDRVDLERGLINLGRGNGRKRRAIVPIADDLLPMMKEAAEAMTSPFVIEFGGGRVGSVKTAFRRATERAGLKGVTAHVLRHTAATWMVQKGVPTAMVARFLGNTEAMVEAVYGHHSPDYLRQAAAALNFRKSA